jgi:hypothetical protein
MNNTNRVLNRTLIAIFGLLALLIGAALVAIGVLPAVRTGYRGSAPAVHGAITGWLKTIPPFDSGTSWGWILVLALLVLIVILLLVFIFRQGHGHHDTVFRENTTPAGTTIIDSDVAERTIQDDLDGRPEFVASRVSTYRVRGTPVLKISVTCRRGVSPRDVTTTIEKTLTALDALLGREVPALIQISGGFRARLSRSTRTQ